MRWRTLMVAATLLASAIPGAPAIAGPDGPSVVRTDVSFEVTNLHTPGVSTTLRGYRVDPPCAATTVVLLQHGLSYTSEAWDFGGEGGPLPDLSWSRLLARNGYAVVAIDRLGYGRSELADGRAVSTLAYHHMGAQVVDQLREEFDHVAIGGHSAGGEASIGAAGLFGAGDALLVFGYHHIPAVDLVAEFVTGDVVRALQDDYEYFLHDPDSRRQWFYAGGFDAAVADADTASAVPTPSGEILTIGPQPSRLAAFLVRVPVFLQLATLDRLFPASSAALAELHYPLAPSVDVDVVENAGHAYLLHDAGLAAAQRAADWLRSRPETPPCETPEPTAVDADTSPAPPSNDEAEADLDPVSAVVDVLTHLLGLG